MRVSWTVANIGPLRMRCTLDTSGLDAYHAWMLQHAANEKHALWDELGEITRSAYRTNFAVGGRPPWRELAESTILEKERLLGMGMIPRKTKTGRIPPRLMQRGGFSAQTILIREGTLRDSWVQKGARGHYEEEVGDTFFVGSQLTVTKEAAPPPPEKLPAYYILTKKALARRAKGESTSAQIPLARLHEEGTSRMPARPVAVLPSGEATLSEEELSQVAGAAALWIVGGL